MRPHPLCPARSRSVRGRFGRYRWDRRGYRRRPVPVRVAGRVGVSRLRPARRAPGRLGRRQRRDRRGGHRRIPTRRRAGVGRCGPAADGLDRRRTGGAQPEHGQHRFRVRWSNRSTSPSGWPWWRSVLYGGAMRAVPRPAETPATSRRAKGQPRASDRASRPGCRSCRRSACRPPARRRTWRTWQCPEACRSCRRTSRCRPACRSSGIRWRGH